MVTSILGLPTETREWREKKRILNKMAVLACGRSVSLSLDYSSADMVYVFGNGIEHLGKHGIEHLATMAYV